MDKTALEKLTEKIELAAQTTVENVVEPSIEEIKQTAEDLKKYIEYQEYESNIEPFDNSLNALKDTNDTDSKNFIERIKDFWTTTYAVNKEESTVNKDSRIVYNVLSSLNDNKVTSFLSNTEIELNTALSTVMDSIDEVVSNISENSTDSGVISKLKSLSSTVGSAVSSMASSFLTNLKSSYNDGVTETSFGVKEFSSWQKLVADIKSGNTSKKIKVLTTSPLDAGSNSTSLYGTMMLGCPPTFISRTDPLNRGMINSFVKDAKFLSLTPGLPKYNGSRYNHNSSEKNILKQTESSNEMLNYLIKNGVDSDNLSKDKRYYIFQTAFGKFYSYLETMLNTIWLKMGLGTEDNNTFNLYTFFNELDIRDTADPKAQYQSAIGFYVNPIGAISENIVNERTNIGESLASQTNDRAQQFQQINYLTGMGTGSAVQKIMATTNKSLALIQGIKDFTSQTFSNTIYGWQSNTGLISKIVGAAGGALKDVYAYTTQQDIGATLQAYTSVNGMQVMYPELWSRSDFSKALNFDFNFSSPYGDPLSIFKYVYVPFCTLLCFAMPRQADDNGFVSPFFIRADMPGLFSCDLGIITNITYTRGGAQGLFTKDGLPRAISGSFTIEDLFPYLAMTRRLSFLSANPSYTSFLDSMTGFSAVYEDDSDSSSLNEYFKQMLNRTNGKSSHNKVLWNRFDSSGRASNKLYATKLASNKLNVSPKSISWLRKV